MTQKLERAFVLTEKRLRAQLDLAMVPDHPVAKGDIAESAWRSVIAEYLPDRYSVSNGFIADTRGGVSEQIDCIVYDGFYAPKLFGESGHVYIPVEAVQAVFEIKQAIGAREIKSASKKAASVRRLERIPPSVPPLNDGDGEAKPLLPIIGGLFAQKAKAKDGMRASSVRKALEAVMLPDSENEFDRDKVDGGVDVILTASSGFVDFFDTGYPPIVERAHLGVGEGALMHGLFRIISAMQTHEDPPGFLWKKYAVGKRSAGWITRAEARRK